MKKIPILVAFIFLLLKGSTQNVGIGTLFPQAKLHVESGFLGEALRLTSDFGPTISFRLSGSLTTDAPLIGTNYTNPSAPDFRMSTPAGFNLPIKFYTNDNLRMHIAESGNIGIGTSGGPAALLHIKSNTVEAVRVEGPNAAQTFFNGTNYVGYLQAYNSTMSLASQGTNKLGLFTSFAERLTILPDGNIGVNNTTPVEKLDVSGNVKFSGSLLPAGQTGANYDLLMSTGGGSPEWHSPGYALAAHYTSRNISTQFYNSNGTFQINFFSNPGFLFNEPALLFYNLMFTVNDIDEPFGPDSDFDIEVRFKDQLNATAHSQTKNFIVKNGRFGVSCAMSGMFLVGAFPLQSMSVTVYITKHGGGQLSLVSGGIQTVY